MHCLHVFARGTLGKVGLHRGVCEAPALIGGDRRARKRRNRQKQPSQNPQRRHERLHITAVALGVGGSLALTGQPSLADERAHPRDASSVLSASPNDSAPASRASVSKATAEFAAYTDTNAVTVFTPSLRAQTASPYGAWSAEGHYLADIVTAASVDIVTSASPRWTEVRHEAGLAATYRPGPTSFTARAQVSSEPDYLSLGAGLRLDGQLAGKRFNPLLIYSLAHDTAGRTGTPFSVYSKKLWRHDLAVGAEMILDRRTTLQVVLDSVFELGDAADPYRYLPLFAPDVAPRIQPGASLATVNELRLPGRIDERVPGERIRISLSGRLARRFRHSTAIFAERLYADDWGLFATSSEGRWLTDIGEHWTLWLTGRLHGQTGVSFWKRAYEASIDDGVLSVPTYRSGDRELGPLLSGTLGLGARFAFELGRQVGPWSITAQFDETATSFRDALYVAGRLAHLGIIDFEGDF